MARDHILDEKEFELIGGYFSPVSDAYNKPGLASAPHRVKMCLLATDGESPFDKSDWLMVDEWEARQSEFQRTAKVLDHFDEHLNKFGGILLSTGEIFFFEVFIYIYLLYG